MSRPSRRLLVVLAAGLLVTAMGPLLPKGALRRVPYDIVPSGSMFLPQLSANGRWLSFHTGSNNMLPEGNDSSLDVFLADLKKGTLIQVSRTVDGGNPTQGCAASAISPTGRFIAYQSSDTNIVPGDTPNTPDVFLFDAKKGTTVRVSEDDEGGGSAAASSEPAISKNGRWVAFSSLAGNLVDGDTNGDRDVFLRDVKKGVTTILSLTSEGEFTDAESDLPRISANGRFVAFASMADLVPEDENGHQDVYLADVKKGTLTLVSVGHEGQQGDADSGSFLDISANGRYVSFTSGAQNLVPDDVAFSAVFVRDMKKGTLRLASAAADGTPAVSVSTAHDLSPDGRYVAFQSFANNLVPPDANAADDVFLKDLETGAIERISVGFRGVEADDTSSVPTVSIKGRHVAFQSLATVLLDGKDENPATDIFVKRR